MAISSMLEVSRPVTAAGPFGEQIHQGRLIDSKRYNFSMKKDSGFSLVELSIFIVVLGLLLGGAINSLSARITQARVLETRKEMDGIKLTLIGYVISNGRLPCPDVDGDGNGDPYPLPVASACDANSGFLPSTELATAALDPWGNQYLYATDSLYTGHPGANQVSFSLVDPDGTLTFRPPVGEPQAYFLSAVFFSVGPNKNTTLADATDDEDENLDGDNIFVSRKTTNDALPGFDDIIEGISSFELKAIMVKAQRLP